MKLTFLGAAETVTGSKHLLSVKGSKILLDCGLFQGLKDLRARNWQDPAFKPGEIDAVVLSHAHLDHSGYLPLLVKKGFQGPIYCTLGTRDLVQILLRDAAHLQEEDAARANRYGYSKHHPALPLYTQDDVNAALKLLRNQPYGKVFEVTPDIKVSFRRAGHILGSALVEAQLGGKNPHRLVFTGDLGRANRPIICDPEPIRAADTLIIEATYGDKVHPTNAKEELARVIREAAAEHRAILVPAFAVGRTQDLIWFIRELEEKNEIPSIPVFIDSPMAIDVTEIYKRHSEEHDAEMKSLLARKVNPLSSRNYRVVHTPDESKALNRISGPLIIIAGSGMATGGRILHHLKLRLPNPSTTVLLVGFQAVGTRGRALQDGNEMIRIHGEEVPVRAKIQMIDGLSAHADREDIFHWLGFFQKRPKKTFLVHAELPAAESLAQSIKERLGWSVQVAQDGKTVALT